MRTPKARAQNISPIHCRNRTPCKPQRPLKSLLYRRKQIIKAETEDKHYGTDGLMPHCMNLFSCDLLPQMLSAFNSVTVQSDFDASFLSLHTNARVYNLRLNLVKSNHATSNPFGRMRCKGDLYKVNFRKVVCSKVSEGRISQLHIPRHLTLP